MPRVNRYIDRYGHEEVEAFLDACLSLEDLVVLRAPHIRRRDEHVTPSAASPVGKNNEEDDTPGKLGGRTSCAGVSEPATRNPADATTKTPPITTSADRIAFQENADNRLLATNTPHR